ncbi:MAG TPA: RtcB family protein [Gemmatimonadaceae bacterium]|nr:RtcB family protein [Gemmatimonadaceae bacterium]
MTIFGTHDPKTLEQFHAIEQGAEKAALMADGHAGYSMPIGGVAAYDNAVSVTGVGFDIACGNAAIRTDARLEDFSTEQLQQVASDIQRSISFGVGRDNRHDDPTLTEHELFSSPAWDAYPHAANATELKNMARAQLGTVGSGNHYVDVFADETGHLWVGVHFGSRGLGHKTASGILALEQNRKWGERVPEKEAILPLSSPLGEAYWNLMNLAGLYAYAGREWVARKVVSILGAKELELVHNHHNFAWKETHEGQELVVVRKGATPAFPGQQGFVGGSMGDNAVILAGNATDTAREALFSTVHGAGRVMSRTQARGKLKGWGRKARIVSPGLISPEMMKSWLDEKGVILKGGGLDEAPQAYRRLPDVLAAQGDTINVLHELRPLVVVMAGAEDFDPYKD